MELASAYDSLGGDIAASFSLVVVSIAGLVVVVWDAYRNDSRGVPWLAGLALAAGLLWELQGLDSASRGVFYDLVRVGGVASYVTIVILASGLLTVILSVSYLARIGRNYGEVYALILFATAGMIVLGTANNLITIFVGLETMSICLYIMAGLVRDDEGGTESALKYFVLGAFSTGFFLYGIALIYGATGTMYLDQFAAGLDAMGGGNLFWAGVALLLVGFLFKVSAAPFHMWTPDVYQGAPTTLTGYMSTASKAAAFAALVLVLYYGLPGERWSLALAVMAVITMVMGNIVALAQTNVKRMLAYSSIAHAGYILVGLAAGTPDGYSGAMYYLLVYSLMNIGAFGVMSLLEWDGTVGRIQTLDSLAGVGFKKPFLGIAMGVFMFSLTGFPPLAGFFGKYAVFAPAVDAGYTWLVIIAVLTSAASAFYYLRVLYVFWMQSPDEERAGTAAKLAAIPVTPAATVALIVCIVLLVVLGVDAGGLLETTASFFETGPGVAVAP